MVDDRSSVVSKNDSRETNQWAAYGIEEQEFRQEEQPSENNESKEAGHNLELTLASGGFPVASIAHSIPPPPPVNHQEADSDTSSLINAIGRDNSVTCLLRCPRATYGAIALLNRSFRQLIKSGEIYKLRYDKNVIEHWVYFSCELAKWEAFDPSNRKWMRLPIIDGDQCFKFTDKESMAVGTQLLVFGRGLDGHVTYKYSLLTHSWCLGKVMNTPRCLFGSASLGQVAIFAGGVNRNGEILDAVELYDSRSGNWETLPSLIIPRKLGSGVYMDGKFYVIGGIGKERKPLTCGEEYDSGTKKWTEIPGMSPVVATGGGMAPPLVAVVGNELYAADTAEMRLKKYDKKKKEWEVIGRLPERAHSMDGWGMAFRGCGERLIVVGGPRRCCWNVMEIYSWMPSKGPPVWRLIGERRSDSFVYNCAVMGC